jgi:hypothetical protein
MTRAFVGLLVSSLSPLQIDRLWTGRLSTCDRKSFLLASPAFPVFSLQSPLLPGSVAISPRRHDVKRRYVVMWLSEDLQKTRFALCFFHFLIKFRFILIKLSTLSERDENGKCY